MSNKRECKLNYYLEDDTIQVVDSKELTSHGGYQGKNCLNGIYCVICLKGTYFCHQETNKRILLIKSGA